MGIVSQIFPTIHELREFVIHPTLQYDLGDVCYNERTNEVEPDASFLSASNT